MPDTSDIERKVAALARDRVSGAGALARRAARILQAAAGDDGKSLARWQQRLRGVGRAIVAAQPAMGSLRTVVAAAVQESRQARTVGRGSTAVRRSLDRYLRRQPVALERAAARLGRLLPPRSTCLTLSLSEAVCRALVLAHGRRRLASVVVAESRPGGEGRELARRLAARRLAVTLVADALAPASVREVDAVVVGADAVTARAVWNKCGTLGLALAARAAHRPFYVVTTSDRLLPPSLARGVHAPDAEPEGVIARPLRDVRVVSRLFDATPIGLVTAVVTERGVMTGIRVATRLRGA